MSKIADGTVAVLVAIVGLAIVAVLVSRSAQTSTVVQSAGQAFNGIIIAAVSPVSSGSFL